MGDNNGSRGLAEQERRRNKARSHAQQEREPDLSSAEEAAPAMTISLLSNRRIDSKVNRSTRAGVIRKAQQTHGNRAVQRMLQSSSRAGKPVQRAFWNDKDMENDFWGTKQLMGDKWGGVADATMSAAWNLGGVIPGIGTAEGLVGAGVDGLKSLYSSGAALGNTMMGDYDAADADLKASKRFGHDMELSAMSAIPIWGTGQGAVTGLWDAASAIDRATGGKPAPLSGDIWDQASPL